MGLYVRSVQFPIITSTITSTCFSQKQSLLQTLQTMMFDMPDGLMNLLELRQANYFLRTSSRGQLTIYKGVYLTKNAGIANLGDSVAYKTTTNEVKVTA